MNEFTPKLEKATLDDAHMRFVVEDVRVRHRALIDLINQTSDQALKLLSLYVTLLLAAVTLGFANIGRMPIPVIVGTLAGLMLLLVGCRFCFRAAKPASVALPGRDAAFWAWSLQPGVSRVQAFGDYLSNVQQQLERNKQLNEETANAMYRAKQMGAAAPVAAVALGGAVALILQFRPIWF